MNLKLRSSVKVVKGVGEKYLDILNKTGINSVFDLLLRFPLFYIDFSNPAQAIDTTVKRVYRIEIKDFKLAQLYRKRLSILNINAIIAKSKKNLRVTLFNRPYLFELLKKIKGFYIYGKPEKTGGTAQAYQVNNPMIFIDDNAQAVLPVYNKISTIKAGILRKLIGSAFAVLQDDLECLPGEIVKKYCYTGISAALRSIHLPQDYQPEKIDGLKNRFIYREFLYFQLELQYTRNFFKKVRRLNSYTVDNRVKETLKQNLEFKLTTDQVAANRDIVKDLKNPFTMQRLLQGDVGSGKTIVAFLALLIAKENGYQGAFLAPTEILTNQHFSNAKGFFKNARIEQLTGSTPTAAGKEIRRRLSAGEIDIIFGTHALLNENLQFKNLSMVVIDEQHRFGVSQRAALYYKGKSVDLLVTTATPIPRTMLLSIYNDLSVSLIKTKPHGRLPITTKIIANRRRDEFYGWLKGKIREKGKAFIILPLIEESEFFTELRSIEKESPYFEEMFAGMPIGIVSGRTPAEEKDKLLNEFAQDTIRVLISTTVIEVGIDVKDATIMVIEDADRYGLSQLHQLRGRVDRGILQSYCYLLPSPNITESGKQRLKTMAATNDGFKIAEIDLEMRGSGIITGIEQSGYLDFKLGDTTRDHRIFEAARKDAASLLSEPSRQNDHISSFLTKVARRIKHINFS
ncbi:ATP-dependent DNA helicase RecG [Acidobacteriota bacterium]